MIRRLAILVDAENVDPHAIPKVIEDATAHGWPCIRRAYSAVGHQQPFEWKHSVYAKLGFIPTSVPAVVKGKNSADIALAVDAMELALTGRVDAVCVVSNDSDFTFLALKLRENGIKVLGAGDWQASIGWRGACDVFLETSSPPARLLSCSSTQAELHAVLRECVGPEDVSLAALGSAVKQRSPDFNPRDFGYPKLLKAVEATPGLRLFMKDGVHWISRIPTLRLAGGMDDGANSIEAEVAAEALKD